MGAKSGNISTMLSSDQVFSVRVKTVRFREGYNADQVDEFLEEVVESLKWLEAGQITGPNGEIPLGPDDVRNKAFDTTKYDSAYDMREVDDLLQSIEQTLEHFVRVYRGGTILTGQSPISPTTTPPGYLTPPAPQGVTTASWTQPQVGYPTALPPHLAQPAQPVQPALPVQSVDFPVNNPQAQPVLPQTPISPPQSAPSPPAVGYPQNNFPTVGY